MTTKPEPIGFLRVNSHRAGDRLKRALKREDLDYHYTWETGSCLVPVFTDEEISLGRTIPSVTLARLSSKPLRCWRT